MKITRKTLITATLSLLLGTTSFASNKLIQAKGSDTILNVTQSMAETYMTKNKDARIAVVGGGSGTGISSLINGTTDIALASRSMKSKEIEAAAKNGIEAFETVIGFDGITVAVNKNNTIKDISMENLGKIFRGEITNWKELGGADASIVVLSRDSSSGTHEYFKEAVVRGGDSKGTQEFAPKTLFLPSNEALKKELNKNKNAIAYLGMGYVDDTVAVTSVNGVKATVENVKNKKYPIAREVFWYTKKNMSPEVTTFRDFALSADGQAIVAEEGFVPVK